MSDDLDKNLDKFSKRLFDLIEQGTDGWFAERLGKVTASRVADVVAKTKSGYSASRANYMAELVVERLTGQRGASFSNAAMQWGTEQEPNARAAYEARTGHLVEETGFVPHPTIPMSGASPDGLVGDNGLVEIKCPNTATHIETMLSGTVPEKYMLQMMWQMACTDRKWCDFVSYDPRLPENMQLWIKRIELDLPLINGLEREVMKFLAELDAKIDNLNKLYGEA
jgi:putative phage-type endonuclease